MDNTKPGNSQTQHQGRQKELRSTFDEIIDVGTEKFNQAQQEITEYTEELVDTIKKHPLKAVLIAGGIGVVLSALLKK